MSFKFKPKQETISMRLRRHRKEAKAESAGGKILEGLVASSIVVGPVEPGVTHVEECFDIPIAPDGPTRPEDDPNISETYRTHLRITQQIQELASEMHDLREMQNRIRREIGNIKAMNKTLDAIEGIYRMVHVKLRHMQGLQVLPTDIICAM